MLYDQSLKAALRGTKAPEDWTDYEGPAAALKEITHLLSAEAEEASSNTAPVQAPTSPGGSRAAPLSPGSARKELAQELNVAVGEMTCTDQDETARDKYVDAIAKLAGDGETKNKTKEAES